MEFQTTIKVKIEKEDGVDGHSNIKQEPNVEYLLILPPQKELDNFPLPIKVEKDITEQCEDIESEDQKFTDQNQKIKHEPSVEYLLVLPREDEAVDCEFPLPIKEENEKSVSSELQRDISEKKIVCKKCPAVDKFDPKTTLFRMCKKHKYKIIFRSDTATFECDFCAKVFSYREGLAQHIDIHFDHMKKACKICGTILVKYRMRQHMVHSHGTARHKCDLCSFVGNSRAKMKSHMMSHLKPYKCKVCKKRFSETRYRNEHEMSHEKPNPFPCTKCSSSYTRHTSLLRHMQTAHSEARNFACSECKYTGKTQDDLTTHQKSHTRAYQCDVCKRKFSRSTHLKEHRVLHDNPDAYQCQKCKSSFTQRKLLKDHSLKPKHQKLCAKRSAQNNVRKITDLFKPKV